MVNYPLSTKLISSILRDARGSCRNVWNLRGLTQETKISTPTLFAIEV